MCKEGDGCSFLWSTGQQPWDQEEGGQQGGGKTWWASDTSVLWCGGQNHPGDSTCAEYATTWEIWELSEMKQDTQGSPCKDTVNKGRWFVQPLPFSLMDLATEGCSVLFDFLSLKCLLLFLGKVTLWRRFKQIHLSPSVLAGWSWQQLADLGFHIDEQETRRETNICGRASYSFP